MLEQAKLCVIGLDAATFELIHPWIREGLLPNLAQLINQGSSGVLQSTLHPLSPPAWTSLITGKNPGKHGIYDFVVHKPHSYELQYTNGGMRRGKSIWRLLSDAGKRVVVINVPMTYPPEEVNGALIAGFDAPGINSDFVHPKPLLKEITDTLGGFILRDYPQGHSPDTFLQQIHNILDFRRKLTLYMLQREAWDFFMVVFGALDLVQHGYWQYMDKGFPTITPAERTKYGNAIKELYIKVDGIVGELLAALPADVSLMVLSDHGAGPCYKAIFINKWLESIGLLKYKHAAGSTQVLKRVHQGIKRAIPPEGLEWLKRRFPALRQQVKSKLVFSEIDWPQTKAYSFGRESTNLFINLAGRLPQGVVNPGQEYEKLCDFLAEALMGLRDPETNELAVHRVYRRDEVYHGDCLDSAPDLLVSWRDSKYTSWPGYDDKNRSIFESSLKHSDYSDWSSLQKGGNHRPNGILLLAGPGMKRGLELDGARIIDLAPTILYLMGVPIPVDMDGRVLTEALEASLKQARVPEYAQVDIEAGGELPASAYTAQEAQEIEERLRSLGYVD